MPTPMTSAHVEVAHVTKEFPLPRGATLPILEDISLSVPPAKVLAILGVSGCGKSTLLRIIAGLDDSFSGDVNVDGAPIVGPGLDRGFIFQDHCLVPWMTVTKNIALGLHKLNDVERNRIVSKTIALVGLSSFSESYPSQLSGGMAQRVAIARAIAHSPRVLLLDEPFGALDALTKLQMQEEILRIQSTEAITMILVTHDIEEALFLADEILILSSRPGHVRERLPVVLSRPRQRMSVTFTELRQDIYQRFFARPH